MAAKQRLASFSIETDQEVLVSFEDGSSRRLLRSELRGQLHADDYARISKAFRIRQSFWRRNLPGSLAVVMAGAAAVAALLVTADRPLFHLVSPHHTQSDQPPADFVAARSIPTPSPKPSASTSPSPVKTAAPESPSPTTRRSNHQIGLLHRLSGMFNRMLQ